MDHAHTLQDLSHAEKHVEMGKTLIAESYDLLQRRRSSGLDVSEAEATLALLEETHARYLAERDRLRRELETLH